MVYSYSGVSLNKNKGTADKCNNLDNSQKHGEQKKINKKENELYDSVYIRFKKRGENPPSGNQPVSDCLQRRLEGGSLHQGVRELSEMPGILTVVFIAWACMFVKTLYALSGSILL